MKDQKVTNCLPTLQKGNLKCSSILCRCAIISLLRIEYDILDDLHAIANHEDSNIFL